MKLTHTTTVESKWNIGDKVVSPDDDSTKGGYEIAHITYDGRNVIYELQLSSGTYPYAEVDLVDWGYHLVDPTPREKERYYFDVDTPAMDAPGRLDLLVDIERLVKVYGEREGWKVLSRPTYGPIFTEGDHQ